MNNNLQKNVEALCRTIESAINRDGSLNVSAAARAISISQPKLKRILDGKHEQVRPDTEKALCDYFGITQSDLYSDTPITSIDDARIRAAIDLINNLPPEKHARAAAEINMLKMLLAKGSE